MGIFDKFESGLDRLVNGAFAKAFQGDVQPVEIVARLHKEMTDRAAVVSRARTVVPNEFTVYLSEYDFERLDSYSEGLTELLNDSVREFGEEQRYTFLGPIQVELAARANLQQGVFLISSQTSRVGPAQVDPGGRGTSLHPRLIDSSGTPFPLSSEHIVLGRGTDVDIRFEDSAVSRRHAEIVLGDTIYIKDLGSTNGTFVDGKRIQHQQLADGSVIRLGSTDVTFRRS